MAINILISESQYPNPERAYTIAKAAPRRTAAPAYTCNLRFRRRALALHTARILHMITGSAAEGAIPRGVARAIDIAVAVAVVRVHDTIVR